MPAHRSRTERWQECLEQILSRGGGIEIAPARAMDANGQSADLLWRVRLISIEPEALLVERPTVAGAPVPLSAGDAVVGVMTIGQNRWMFATTVERAIASEGRGPGVLSLRAPERVERCRRSDPYRVSTAAVNLPRVECWPLLDPTTVVAAEMATRSLVRESLRTGEAGGGEAVVLPEVGPLFEARLMNIGGGGLGLVVESEHASALERSRLIWMRLWLTPEVPEPIGLTARVAHSHLDSTQQRYAGCAFEFTFNPGHKAFVVDAVGRFIAARLGRSAAVAA